MDPIQNAPFYTSNFLNIQTEAMVELIASVYITLSWIGHYINGEHTLLCKLWQYRHNTKAALRELHYFCTQFTH